MAFETGLVDKLQEITNLKVYPEYAQEGTATPYVVYTRQNTEYERKLEDVEPTLDGVIFELHLITDSKSDAVSYGDSIETKLREMFLTTVGGKNVQDVDIINRFTQWETAVEKYREVIEFTVYY